MCPTFVFHGPYGATPPEHYGQTSGSMWPDHRPVERKDQWEELQTTLQSYHAEDVCLLADYNYLALPAQDAARPEAKESPQVGSQRNKNSHASATTNARYMA